MSAPADFASQQGLARRSVSLETILRWLDPLFLPLAALLAGMLLFAVFLLLIGTSPIEFYTLVYKAGFGTSFPGPTRWPVRHRFFSQPSASPCRPGWVSWSSAGRGRSCWVVSAPVLLPCWHLAFRVRSAFSP